MARKVRKAKKARKAIDNHERRLWVLNEFSLYKKWQDSKIEDVHDFIAKHKNAIDRKIQE